MCTILTLISILVGGVGCGRSSPQETLAAYGQAIAENDPDRAYTLLSPKTRQAMSFEEFKTRWPAYRTQLMPSVGALMSAREHPARVTATLQATDLDALGLDLHTEGWKITSGAIDPYAQTTPRRALYSFIKAMDEERAEILWNFIPSEYAEQMTLDELRDDLKARAPELKTLTDTLRRHRTNPIEIAGDRAYMRYGDRQVVFRLESAVWKIEDPDG